MARLRWEGSMVSKVGCPNVAGMAASMHKGRGDMHQGGQQGGLNHARDLLATLCREMWGFKLIAHWILFEG